MQNKNVGRTICGIATPTGNGGVGIVRISGPQALEIANKMFDKPLAHHKVVVGTIHGKDFTDNGLAIYFKAPHSFTGDDVVELQCHGGYFLLQKIVQAALSHGAEMATAGEFSKTAFLNGKLSLDQAEAIIDIIHAESDLQLGSAGKIYSGALRDRLDSLEKVMVDITAQIEATLDYPEHDIEHTTAQNILPQIRKLREQIGALISTAHQGRIISNGINVAVLGKPNVGKSSVFNALLNTDRSIVTATAGTTTDTISESIHYNGIKITFHDTAGIRESGRTVEKLGIERTKKMLNDCDIVLVILDDVGDAELLGIVGDKPHIIVYNKSDIKKYSGVFSVSAKTGANIDEIKKRIYDIVVSSPIKTDAVIITNARHLNELVLSANALDSAIHALQTDIPLDCVASDVATALNHIGNITGTRASDAVLSQIFSRFCLGK